ncbi:MAG: gluconate 2-dehydrogenase subunit 3 family protein [Candidatus Binatia bacterium]
MGAALQPLASLTGDCYEAASIPITRLANFAGLDWALRLRGDDLTKVVQQAALVHSPLAWGLVAAGCLGGLLVAALTLILSGGVAPRGAQLKLQQAPEGSSRRSLLRAGLALALLATGGWILRRVYLPRRLKPAEVDTLAALLDTLIPGGEFPGARQTGFLDRLLRECDSKRQTRRALVEGVQLLDSKAGGRGASGFLGLEPQQREEVVEECARGADGTLPRFFYRTVRDRAMQLHYSQPATWKPLRFDHPPQPEGYLNYWQKPDA